MKIIELSESEAGQLMVDLENMINADDYVRTIKFSIQGHGLMYKIGEGVWTPTLGHLLNSAPTDGTERWLCRYCGRVIPGEVSSRPCPSSPDLNHIRGERWYGHDHDRPA